MCRTALFQSAWTQLETSTKPKDSNTVMSLLGIQLLVFILSCTLNPISPTSLDGRICWRYAVITGRNKSVNSNDVCILTFKVPALLQGLCHLQVLLLAECNYRGAGLVMCITLSSQRVDTHMVMPDSNTSSFCIMLSCVS